MAKILLTWEAGAYLGHEMLVTCAGVLLREAGHEVVIYAPAGVEANHAARVADIRWEHTPAVPDERKPSTGLPWESRATTLWRFGFHSAEVIAERFGLWDAVLHREQPDVVVLQAAPFAQLAAHGGGYASIEFGIGFDVPPQHSPFPAFRGAQHFSEAAGKSVEDAILRNISRAVSPSVVAGYSLSKLVSGHKRLVTSVPELDHYDSAEDVSRRFIGPLPVAPLAAEQHPWRAAKTRLLAYVRAELVDAPAFVKAVAGINGDAVVVCIGAGTDAMVLARSLGVRLFASPIAIASLLAQADVVVSHGGGLMAEAVILGRPCLALPSHFEQFLTARKLQRRKLGVMANPEEPTRYTAALRYVLASEEIRRAAAALAQRHQAMRGASGPSFVQTVSSLAESH